MNGDPNSPREDVLGALALVDATIDGMADSRDKLRLAMASSALRRANEKLRGYTDEHLADVIELRPLHSVKVGA